jgi:hypothetical protein
VRDNNANDNGGDWVPEHAPRVQREWQLRWTLTITGHHTDTFRHSYSVTELNPMHGRG